MTAPAHHEPMLTTDLPHLTRLHQGKVRDVYAVDADRLLLVTLEYGTPTAGRRITVVTGAPNLKPGDAACDAACEDLYAKLNKARRDVLYDDRDERPGVKFANMDLIGIPWQIVVGPKGVAKGMVEIKRRAGSAREELTADAALNKVMG